MLDGAARADYSRHFLINLGADAGRVGPYLCLPRNGRLLVIFVLDALLEQLDLPRRDCTLLSDRFCEPVTGGLGLKLLGRVVGAAHHAQTQRVLIFRAAAPV